jgi:hypothetical protein
MPVVGCAASASPMPECRPRRKHAAVVWTMLRCNVVAARSSTPHSGIGYARGYSARDSPCRATRPRSRRRRRSAVDRVVGVPRVAPRRVRRLDRDLLAPPPLVEFGSRHDECVAELAHEGFVTQILNERAPIEPQRCRERADFHVLTAGTHHVAFECSVPSTLHHHVLRASPPETFNGDAQRVRSTAAPEVQTHPFSIAVIATEG